MKPTQEQILKALNKLVRENKTELKAEKIELGLVDDLISNLKETAKKVDRVSDVMKKLMDANKEKDVLLKSSESLIKENRKRLSVVEKQAKELGVSINELPKEVKTITSRTNTLDSLIAKLRKL